MKNRTNDNFVLTLRLEVKPATPCLARNVVQPIPAEQGTACENSMVSRSRSSSSMPRKIDSVSEPSNHAPVLSVVARAHYFVGPFGAVSRMKFVANLLVAIHNVAAAEALVLGMKAGLDGAQVLRLVGEGAGSSRILQLRGPMMVKGRYQPPTMTLANFEKDLATIAAFARKVGARTPLFSAAAPIYAAARRKNPTLDTAAVCAVLERMARLRRRRAVTR